MGKTLRHFGRSRLARMRTQPEFMRELGKLEEIAPHAGFGLQFTDHDGKTFMIVNRRIPPQQGKARDIPGAETILELDNGDRFRTIRLFATDLSDDESGATRSALVCAALEVAMQLERLEMARQAA